VPSYADRVINEGSVFHVVTYGLNSMGSHANQLSQEERWLVAAYVMQLKSKL
jgi:mono/diheme cytochrome c family protein